MLKFIGAIVLCVTLSVAKDFRKFSHSILLNGESSFHFLAAEGFPKCSKSDPKISECLITAIDQSIQLMKDGETIESS